MHRTGPSPEAPATAARGGRRTAVGTAGTLAVLAVVGVGTYRYFARESREYTKSLLVGVASNRATMLRTHLDERVSDATLLAGHREVEQAVDGALSDAARAEARSAARAALQQSLVAYRYHRARVFDAAGAVVVSVGSGEPGPVARAAVAATLRTRASSLVPMARAPDGEMTYGAAAPVVVDGVVRGAVLLEMNASRVLHPLLRDAAAGPATLEGELFQCADDTAMLVVSTGENVATNLVPTTRLRDPRLLAARAGTVSRLTVAEARDYRDVDVLAALVPVPGSPWVVVAKIDRAEAEAPVLQLAFVVAGTVLFVAALVALLARSLWIQRSAIAARANARLAERTQRVVQASTDGYGVLDGDGRIVEVNGGLCAMLGYDEAELLGRPLAELRVDTAASGVAEHQRATVGSGTLRFTTQWRRKDGMVRDVDVSTIALGDGGQVAGFMRDVTEERAARERLERLNRVYAFLNEASESLFVAPSPQEAYEAVCRLAIGDPDLVLAWIGVVDEALQEVRVVAVEGAAAEYARKLRVTTDPALPTSHGPSGQCVLDNATVIANDFANDPRTEPWRSVGHEFGLRASASVPVSIGGAVVAIVTVYSGIIDHFVPEVVGLLEQLARFLAVVLQRNAEHERLAAEERLRRESEERFRGLFDAVPLPVMVARVDSDAILDVNASFTTTYGWTEQDLPSLERFYVQCFPDPSVRARSVGLVAEACEVVAGGGRAHIPELAITCRDGGVRSVVGHLSQVGGELLLAWVDMTELRASQARALEAQAIARLGAWDYDFASQRMHLSESVLRLLGLFADGGAREQPLFAMLPDDERRRLLALWEGALARREPFDEIARVGASEGTVLYGRFRAQIVHGADERPRRAIGSLQDVSRDVEAQQELDRHRLHLEEVVAARTAELARANAILRRADRRLMAMLRLSQRASGLDEHQILELCIDEAVELTGSDIGYLHLVDEAAGCVDCGAWSASVRATCVVTPGQRFGLATPAVWTDAVQSSGPVIQNDLGATPMRAGLPEGCVELRRHIAVPYVDGGTTRLVLGVGNKRAAYDEVDAQELQLIAMDVWTIVLRRRNDLALEEAYRQVHASDERFQFAMDVASEGLWDANLVTREVYFSPSCFSMLGYAPDAVPASYEGLRSIMHPDDAATVRDTVRAALAAKRAADVEYRLVDARGEWRWIRSRGRVVAYDGAGRPTRIVGTHSDQTLRRAQEAQIVAAMEAATQANTAKSAFLATMSHEIRTPLNGVLGMAEILARSHLPPRELDAVRTIQASGRTLLAVIDDILDFSKIEAGRLELDPTDVPLNDLVEDLCASLVGMAHARDVDLYAFVAPELVSSMRVDPVRLRQVIYNLAGNAIKFSGRRAGHRGRVEVPLEPSDDAAKGVVLRVIDDGIGMTAAVLGKLFTAFTQGETSTTRRFGGTGLGLTITRRLVEFMGGSVEVASTPGEGSTFTVRLPLEASAEQVASTRPDLGGVDVVVLRGARCFDAGHVARHLRAAGARVHLAEDETTAEGVAKALRKLCVVVHGEGFAPSTLARSGDGDDLLRRLVFVPGAQLGEHVAQDRVVIVECDLLRASRLLDAVAEAAGLRRPGSGSVADGAADTDGPTPASVAAAQASGAMILVAEDDPVNQKVIVRQLELLGYAYELASNGVEALAAHRRGRHALLLTDLHMPEMDGYTLAQEIRRAEVSGERMPIVALTANALRDEATRATEAGMDGYLTKPLQLATLASALRRWLGSAADTHPAVVATERFGTASPPEGDAVLDVSVLEALVGSDPAVLRDFLGHYRASAEGLGRDLVAAHAAGDAAEVGRLAHKLKSSSKSVGALALGALCADLEAMAKQPRPAGLDAAMGGFDAELAAVLRAVDAAAKGP